MAEGLRAFRVVWRQSLAATLRGRGSWVLAAGFLAGLALLESCTRGMISAEVVVDGQQVDGAGALLGPILYAGAILPVYFVAGLVAAEQMTQAAAPEGPVNLWLSRPIGRGTWACARLAGVLTTVVAGGGAWVAGIAWVLAQRFGIETASLWVGAAGALLGFVVVTGVAMTAALTLGRGAAISLVLLGVAVVIACNANVIAAPFFSAEAGALSVWVTRLTPPIAMPVILSSLALNPGLESLVDDVPSLFVLAAWAVLAVGGLVLAARRREFVG